MSQDAFAGLHTVEKLDRLQAYLEAFVNVFKNKDWATTIYFDAFAGTGKIPFTQDELTLELSSDQHAFVVGSAARAQNLQPSFDRYIFVEKARKKAKELEDLEKKFPHHEIEIKKRDANLAVLEFCNDIDWKTHRAVVFLDPCGNQVSWHTLAAIAGTKAIDLWYLFPAGIGVARQINKKDGTVHFTHAPSLDRIYGTTEWREALIIEEETEPDLFGATEKQKRRSDNAPILATEFLIKRMETIFAGGVLNDWLPLGSNNTHKFSLVFACSNPSPRANSLAMKLARAVMRSSRYGRRK